jgi:hypothetical protein
MHRAAARCGGGGLTTYAWKDSRRLIYLSRTRQYSKTMMRDVNFQIIFQEVRYADCDEMAVHDEHNTEIILC